MESPEAGDIIDKMESPEAGDIIDKKEKDFHERREEVINKSKVLIQEAVQRGYSSEAISEFKENREQAYSAVAYAAAMNQDSSQELQSTAAWGGVSGC